jgi:hypothetical protein
MLMRTAGTVLLVVFSTLLLCAQAPELDATTPEGDLLTKAGLSESSEEKLALLKQFVQSFPNHSAVAWVLAQQVQLYQEQEQHAEALDAADQLFAIDAEAGGVANRLRASAIAVKSAETLQQTDDIIRWAKASYRAAKAAMARPKPEDDDEVAAWESESAYATQISQYADYVYVGLASNLLTLPKLPALPRRFRSRTATANTCCRS